MLYGNKVLNYLESKMKTFNEKQKSVLIKKFHILLGQAGLDDYEKSAILAGYGVQSCKDLTLSELDEICSRLTKQANPIQKDMDKWRKRVLACVCGLLQNTGNDNTNLNLAKAIACRAAKVDNFNAIPFDRLRSIYYAFKHRSDDMKEINKIYVEMLFHGRNDNSMLN